MSGRAGRIGRSGSVATVATAVALAFAPTSGAHATYSVRWGDTLTGIAASFGTSVHALVHANGRLTHHPLRAGTRLRVPGAAVAARRGHPAHGRPVEAAIDYWAARYGVDRRLARALAWMESGYQVDVTSWAGAWGVMQVTPDAWHFVEDVLVGRPVGRTADGNVRVGVTYLHHLLHIFGGDERLALGAYYQGARSVQMHGLLPETRAYVADVLALKARV
jgi:soluble lytic murein transglycosylase-like protein